MFLSHFILFHCLTFDLLFTLNLVMVNRNAGENWVMDDSYMIYSWLCLRLCDWVTDLLWLKASGGRAGLQRTDILLPAFSLALTPKHVMALWFLVYTFIRHFCFLFFPCTDWQVGSHTLTLAVKASCVPISCILWSFWATQQTFLCCLASEI